MAVIKEFREFAVRGSVVDLAVGIIIGAAFGKIVSSLVADLIMPPIGMLLGGLNFVDYFYVLKPGSNATLGPDYDTLGQAKAAGAVTVNYGQFLQTILEFAVVAFAVFLLVKQINRLRRKDKPGPPAAPQRECPFCRNNVPKAASRCGFCTSELRPEA